jgi:SAM-dependent methyltransferase
MRDMPFEDATFDGVISVAAMDHLRWDGTVKAVSEVARVLKPRGEFLLMIVNVDGWVRLASPHAIGHHRRQDPDRWRRLLEESGFAVAEQGLVPASIYYLARKHR